MKTYPETPYDWIDDAAYTLPDDIPETYSELIDAITPSFIVECRHGLYTVAHRKTRAVVYRTDDGRAAGEYCDAMNFGGPY